MKIILVLFVIFFKFVRLSTAGEKLLFQQMLNTHSECQGVDCLAVDTSINRRSLDDIDERRFTLGKLAKRKLCETKHSMNIKRKMYKAADKKIFKILKVVKSHRKKIKIQLKKALPNILSLMKISSGELKNLLRNMNMAKEMTVSGCDRILTFVGTSVKQMKMAIEKIARNIKELTEQYWRYLKTSQRPNLQDLLDKKLKFSDCLKCVSEIVDFSGNRLMEVCHNADSAITTLAESSGIMVIEISRMSCDDYKRIENTDPTLEAYINHSCKQFAEIGQISSDKFSEIAKSCQKFLLQLIKNCIKAFRGVSDKLVESKTAAMKGDEKTKQAAEAGIQVIWKGMDRSNTQKYSDMMSNTTNLMDALFTSVHNRTRTIQGL